MRIASGEYQAWPPRVVRGSAFQPAIASSLNQTVRLARCRKLASYAAQLVTFRFCFGMWCRRAALALNGMVSLGSEQGLPPIPIGPTSPTADLCNSAAPPPSHRLLRCHFGNVPVEGKFLDLEQPHVRTLSYTIFYTLMLMTRPHHEPFHSPSVSAKVRRGLRPAATRWLG